MIVTSVTNFIGEGNTSDAQNILGTFGNMLDYTLGSWGSFSDHDYIIVINSIVQIFIG